MYRQGFELISICPSSQGETYVEMSTTEAVPSIKAILVDNLTSPILVVKCTEKTSKSEMLSRREESYF